MDHHHEAYSARRHPEFVVLEIGDELGALVIHADPDLHGVEIEISPAGDDGRRSHKEVLERSTSEGPAFTAVFDGIPAGEHTLWLHGEPRARGVQIEGAAVVEVDWRSAVLAP